MRGIEGVGVDAANIQVHGRVARKHYGTGVNAVFDQSIHDDGRKSVFLSHLFGVGSMLTFTGIGTLRRACISYR